MSDHKAAKHFVRQLVKQLPINTDTASDLSLINEFKLVVAHLPRGTTKKTIESDLDTYFDIFTKSVERKKIKSVTESNHGDTISQTENVALNINSCVSLKTLLLNGYEDVSYADYISLKVSLSDRFLCLSSMRKYDEMAHELLHATNQDLCNLHLIDIIISCLPCVISSHKRSSLKSSVLLLSSSCLVTYATIFQNNYNPIGSISILTSRKITSIYSIIGFMSIWMHKKQSISPQPSISIHDVFVNRPTLISLLCLYLKQVIAIISSNFDNTLLPCYLLFLLVAYASLVSTSSSSSTVSLNQLQPLIKQVMMNIRHLISIINKSSSHKKLWADILSPFIINNMNSQYNNNNIDLSSICSCDCNGNNVTKEFLDWFSNSMKESQSDIVSSSQNAFNLSCIALCHYGLINRDNENSMTKIAVENDKKDDDDDDEIEFFIDTKGTTTTTSSIQQYDKINTKLNISSLEEETDTRVTNHMIVKDIDDDDDVEDGDMAVSDMLTEITESTSSTATATTTTTKTPIKKISKRKIASIAPEEEIINNEEKVITAKKGKVSKNITLLPIIESEAIISKTKSKQGKKNIMMDEITDETTQSIKTGVASPSVTRARKVQKDIASAIKS